MMEFASDRNEKRNRPGLRCTLLIRATDNLAGQATYAVLSAPRASLLTYLHVPGDRLRPRPGA
jgi:hypothetical protein